jgi:uncharacterized protein
MADSSVYGYGLEGALSVAGAALVCLGVSRRWGRMGENPPALLARWPGQLSDLMLYLMFALLGAFVFSTLTALGLRPTSLGFDERQVWVNLANDLGGLLGIGIFRRVHAQFRAAPIVAEVGSVRSGAITFLVALPFVFVTALLWQTVLGGAGFKTRDQDVVALFQSLHTPVMKAVFVFLAVVVAPCAEELIFRAAIFRYLRSRIPRGWAVLISALLFGGSHLISAPLEGLGSLLPLVTLGAIFALAYERTGRIGTTIVAHALFNLNTLIALLLGVTS